MGWRLVNALAGMATIVGAAGGHAVAQNAQAPGAQAPAGQIQHDQSLADVEHFTGGDAEHGAKLYKRYCSGCHGADGRGDAKTFMPHVSNLTTKDYIEFLPDGFLYTVITEGGAAVGKSGFMPSWKSTLSDQDIKDVIAFIRTLPTY
jgi:mono/diheme cytochrome c family protein